MAHPNPELNLTLKDEIDRSIIFLPQRSSFGRNLVVLFGYFMFAWGILIAIQILIARGSLWNAIAIFVFLAGIGYICTICRQSNYSDRTHNQRFNYSPKICLFLGI
jgi:hypothetical protein